MRPVSVVLAWLLLTLSSSGLLIAPARADDPSPTPSPAPSAAPGTPRTASELLAWAQSHQGNASLVVWREGEKRPRLSQAAHRRMPLASVRKVLILRTAAGLVAHGDLRLSRRVPLGRVERWYAPGTDGGAHPQAVQAYGAQWTVRTVMRAMIEFSDNAAADWLLAQVGGWRAVAKVAREQGMRRQDPVWPLLGEFASWSSKPKQWLQATPTDRARIATRTAVRLHRKGPLALALPPVSTQRRLAEVSVRGTAGEWARLIRRIERQAEQGDRAARLTRAIMSWPRADAEVASQFPVFATKGGQLPGVVNDVTAIQASGGARYYLVQLYRGLPLDVEKELGADYLQQLLVLRIALGRQPGL